MLRIRKHRKVHLLIAFLLILSISALAACSPSSSSTETVQPTEAMGSEAGEMEGMEGMDHEEGEHEHEAQDRIPNEGASIRILSPEDDTPFSEGDEVLVEVEVDQFALGENGSHWHVYVDGTSWGMVEGGRTSEALRGLEPGERKIEVFLAGGDHIELEDGDSITISIE